MKIFEIYKTCGGAHSSGVYKGNLPPNIYGAPPKIFRGSLRKEERIMYNTQTVTPIAREKKLSLSDYIALYKMSMRSYFWRVDGRQLMNAMNNGNEVTPVTVTTPIWIISVLIGYGLPVMFVFSVVSFLQALLLMPLTRNPAMHPGSMVGMVLLSAFLFAICSPLVFHRERLHYNLHFTRSAWWRNTGIAPSRIIKDRGLYGEYIATMAAEQNMKKHGLYGRVFNSVIVPKADGNFNEIDLVCVNEAGIQVIEAKYRAGSFTGGLADSSWTQQLGSQTHTMTNPLFQNNGHVNCLINHLFQRLPAGSARTKASFPYSYVNVALLTNTDCDTSRLYDGIAPAQFFLGAAEGKNGYISLNLQQMYKLRFSKKEVDEICAVLEQISGYSHGQIQRMVQQREQAFQQGAYRYARNYSVVRLESVTADGGTEINDLICLEEAEPETQTIVFRSYMDPKDRMFKAIPNSRIKGQSKKTRNFAELLAYYNRLTGM